MRKSTLAKKFFINTGINITVKTNNGFYSRWRNHPPLYYVPPLNFTVFFRHSGDKRTPFIRLSNLLPSGPNKLNLDSSLKWTIFHCSSVHRICSVAKLKGTFWFFFAIKGLPHGIQATNFSLLNLQETVFLEIGFPVCLQNAREIDVAASKRSFTDFLTLIRSSRLVVIGGLSVLGFCFKCLVNLKSTDYTIKNAFFFFFYLRTIAAISEYDLPSSWFAKTSFFSSRVKQLCIFALHLA